MVRCDTGFDMSLLIVGGPSACKINRTPRNPHSIDRYTGGSSSGPAAIVASGLCPAAIGTDGGGCTCANI